VPPLAMPIEPDAAVLAGMPPLILEIGHVETLALRRLEIKRQRGTRDYQRRTSSV